MARLTSSIVKVRPFLITEDWRPGAMLDRQDLKHRLAPKPRQLDLFAG